MFTKSPQARAATTAARLPKLEVSRERVRT